MKLNLLAWFAAASATLVVAVVICTNPLRNPGPSPVSAEEERAAADATLAEKLSGPRYFKSSSNGTHEEGGPWIKVYDARSQVPRIVAERKLGPEAARAVEQLVENMIEHHPSRLVGGTRIHLLRLNLSLDSIK